jgi:hypothetical protein
LKTSARCALVSAEKQSGPLSGGPLWVEAG